MTLEVYKDSVPAHAQSTIPSEGLFAERFMELCQDYFATLYRRVSEQIWNNGVYSYVRAAYYTCNFSNGVAEYHVPTVLNGENFMQYYRIAISVVPELDEETYWTEALRLVKVISPPMGFNDSGTIFIVAPKVTRKHAFQVWKEKRYGMLKIKRVAGWLVIPIVSPSPEIALKKLITHVTHFWQARVKGFLRKLNVEPWQYDYDVKNLLYSLPKVIENYSSQIIYCLRSMVAHLLYFMDRLRDALRAIGRLNEMKSKVMDVARRLAEALNVLEPKKREEVLAKLGECLLVTHVRLREPNG
jgi:hypothetical protein